MEKKNETRPVRSGDDLPLLDVEQQELEAELCSFSIDINDYFKIDDSVYGNGYDYTYKTLLSAAVEKSDFNRVKFLLDHGANPNIFPLFVNDNREGGCKVYTSPLEIAVKNDFPDLIELLLTRIADPNKNVGYSEHTEVDLATDSVSSIEYRQHFLIPASLKILNMLIAKKVDPLKLAPIPSNLEVANKIHSLQAINLVEKYIEERTNDLREYKTTISFWGFELFHFGYSRQQKLAAANQLLNVLKGSEGPARLHGHIDALRQGELGQLYARCEKSIPKLHDSVVVLAFK